MGSLGETIRKRRIELNLTQEELADRIGDGVRQSGVSRLERDQVSLPRRPRLMRIAKALDLPVGALLVQSGWMGAWEGLKDEEAAVERDDSANAPDRKARQAVDEEHPELRETMSAVRDLVEEAEEQLEKAQEHMADMMREEEDADPAQIPVAPASSQ